MYLKNVTAWTSKSCYLVHVCRHINLFPISSRGLHQISEQDCCPLTTLCNILELLLNKIQLRPDAQLGLHTS